jgi:hypothetical protein
VLHADSLVAIVFGTIRGEETTGCTPAATVPLSASPFMAASMVPGCTPAAPRHRRRRC